MSGEETENKMEWNKIADISGLSSFFQDIQ